MPKPRHGESQKKFVSRAISFLIKKEGLSKQHAIAKAFGIFKSSRKKKKNLLKKMLNR